MPSKSITGNQASCFRRPALCLFTHAIWVVPTNAEETPALTPVDPLTLQEIPSALSQPLSEQDSGIPRSPMETTNNAPPATLLPPAIAPASPPDGLLLNPLVEISDPLTQETIGLTEITETPTENPFFYQIRAKVTFDDNIFLTESNTESDALLRISARAAWESGRRGRSIHWLSAYAQPSYVKFLENSDLDNFDYRLGTLYEFEKGDTKINATLTFDSNSDVDRFTSQRFVKERTSLLIKGNHRWSGKTILDAELAFRHTSNDQLSSTTSYGGRVSALYHVTDKTNIGPFIGIKRSESEGSPSFNSFRGGAHVKYEATDKIDLVALAGVEYRDFESGRSSSLDTSFSFKAKYEGSDKLSHELTLTHRSYPSFNIRSAGYRATTLDYRASYKYTSKIRISGDLGYEYDDYFETGIEDASLPTIHYLYAGLGISYDWTDQHALSASYRYRTSDSTEPNRDFSNHLLELNFSYQF